MRRSGATIRYRAGRCSSSGRRGGRVVGGHPAFRRLRASRAVRSRCPRAIRSGRCSSRLGPARGRARLSSPGAGVRPRRRRPHRRPRSRCASRIAVRGGAGVFVVAIAWNTARGGRLGFVVLRAPGGGVRSWPATLTNPVAASLLRRAAGRVRADRLRAVPRAAGGRRAYLRTRLALRWRRALADRTATRSSLSSPCSRRSSSG